MRIEDGSSILIAMEKNKNLYIYIMESGSCDSFILYIPDLSGARTINRSIFQDSYLCM